MKIKYDDKVCIGVQYGHLISIQRELYFTNQLSTLYGLNLILRNNRLNHHLVVVRGNTFPFCHKNCATKLLAIHHW